MTTSRLSVLLAVMMAGFGGVLLLPKVPEQQPAGVNLELPKFIGTWYGTDLEISDKERTVLGAETDFARKSYKNGRGDEVQVSIVLSGSDMNTSIHRPERCLPAQGWTIANSKTASIAIPSGGTLPMTRLQNLRPIRGDDGKTVATIFNLNYYCFVGYTDITASHLGRTRIDIFDRLLKGYNQRWAYVTVAATGTGRLDEEQTDKQMQEFIKQLIPHVVKDSAKLG